MYKVELSDITDRTVGRHRTISTVSQTWSSATNHEYARSYQYEFFTIDTAIESLLPRNNLHTSWSESTQRRNSKQPAPVVKKIRKFFLTKTQVRMARDAMDSRDTSISELCKELRVTPVTLYQYIDPNGDLCTYGKRVLITNGLINCPGCPLSVNN